jgi:predicted amidohydrolase
MTVAIRTCGWAAAVGFAIICSLPEASAADAGSAARTWRVALVQFDSVPEQPERNLKEMERLARQAVGQGARLVMFHEGTLTDYTPRLNELAERVPDGPACQRVAALAKQLGCFISFGLSEREGDRFFITQVFFGPGGMVHRYRKAWLWREEKDGGYRNEHARYDPGPGPERFTIDGIVATCFICADGEAPRCIQRAKALRPQLVFFPNNRGGLPNFPVFGARANEIGAPMLVTNPGGKGWIDHCKGGCVAFDAQGNVLAKANREGREEILVVDLAIPAAIGSTPGPGP